MKMLARWAALALLAALSTCAASAPAFAQSGAPIATPTGPVQQSAVVFDDGTGKAQVVSGAKPFPILTAPTSLPSNGVSGTATSAAAGCFQVKTGPGNIYGATLYNSVAGWFLFIDSASAPSNGAVSPIEFVRYNTADYTIGYVAPASAPLSFNNGLYICSSTSGPYTLTISATGTISAKAK